MCFLFYFLRRDGYLDAVILVITNCLTPEKSSRPREVVITGYLLPALPIFSNTPHLKPLTYPWLHNSHPSSWVWCDLLRKSVLAHIVGLGACIRHQCSHQIPGIPLLFLCTPLFPFQNDFVFYSLYLQFFSREGALGPLAVAW